MSVTQRRTVMLDEKTFQELKAYSDATGVPIVAVLREVIPDWLRTVGKARLEVINKSKFAGIRNAREGKK